MAASVTFRPTLYSAIDLNSALLTLAGLGFVPPRHNKIDADHKPAGEAAQHGMVDVHAVKPSEHRSCSTSSSATPIFAPDHDASTSTGRRWTRLAVSQPRGISDMKMPGGVNQPGI